MVGFYSEPSVAGVRAQPLHAARNGARGRGGRCAFPRVR